MNNNHFDNSDDFEDIFSNQSKDDEFEDISSGEFEDISSFSDDSDRKNSDFSEDDFSVKYNSAVENRKRQQFEYKDVNEIYEEAVPMNDNEKEKVKTKKGKKNKKRNIILSVVSIILVICLGFGFYGYSIANRLFSSINTDDDLKDNEFISSSELYNNKKQVNILLVGIDARGNESSCRSDTMMLLTIDNENKQIKLTSFLRDSYVQIAGHKKAKLNSAFARGGIQTLIDTLELNFKVEIPYYAIVDFAVFEKGIDLLGGVDVEVTKKESNFTKKSLYDDGTILAIEAGPSVHLNGKEALWYSRIRYLDSDFMRTKRQQKVISAAIAKTKTKSLNELISIAEQLIPMVKTNLSSKTIIKVGTEAFKNKVYNYDIFKYQIPAEGLWKSESISGQGSCLVLDMDKSVKAFHEFLDNVQVKEEPSTKTNK